MPYKLICKENKITIYDTRLLHCIAVVIFIIMHNPLPFAGYIIFHVTCISSDICLSVAKCSRHQRPPRPIKYRTTTHRNALIEVQKQQLQCGVEYNVENNCRLMVHKLTFFRPNCTIGLRQSCQVVEGALEVMAPSAHSLPPAQFNWRTLLI